ncbi:hypothetical protein KI387_022454, partial [Taxus chinensis]
MENLFPVVCVVSSANNEKSNKPESYPFSSSSLSPDHSDNSCMDRPLGSELSCTDAQKISEERDFIGLSEVSSFSKNTDKCGDCEDGDLELSLGLSLWVGDIEKKHNDGQSNPPHFTGTTQCVKILTNRELQSTDICCNDRTMVNGLIGVKRNYNEAIVCNPQQRGQDRGVSIGITPDVDQTRQVQCTAPVFSEKNTQENLGIDKNKANSLLFHRNACRWSQPFAMTQSRMDSVNGPCILNQDKADHQLFGSEHCLVADEPPTKNQAIGWPPIQAHRRNSLCSHPKPSGEKQAIGWPPIRENQRNSLGSHPNPSGENQGGPGNSRFVKVNMDGVAIGRKVDLTAHESYEALVKDLENMFQTSTENQTTSSGSMPLRLLDPTSDMVLTYEDKEGDCMLVGDIPWKMFVNMVIRLRIMKTSDANAL